jgi:type IV pilus assembly protein PilZ
MDSKLLSSLSGKLGALGRRLWRRVRVGIPSVLEWNGQRLDAHCGNLSFGGAFVEVERELPLGDIVRLRLARPHVIEDIDLEAEVRWHAPRGAGLQFVQPGERDLWVLSVIVK